ncbi:MAG: hypothetical protein EAZ32_04865 [Cytophagia bacterium]|nr:MAG: hypothetical protein EAZ38_07285 [Cytophagales bacterium]TAG40894.1 MAG: hypothetical protein EAZ32_04865 [Cytophagia bacterium]TAG61914.1 MAG: hypothetical protein EAZ26_12760 [Runella slithyformis]TAG82571.1 MAG: hypothetical protein EAZ22_05075 [Cytophagales bacterium]
MAKIRQYENTEKGLVFEINLIFFDIDNNATLGVATKKSRFARHGGWQNAICLSKIKQMAELNDDLFGE